MTIRLTEAELIEQFQEADEEELQFDPTDEQDTTVKFTGQFAQGWKRRIELREGTSLEINQIQHKGRMILIHPEESHDDLSFNFFLSGDLQVQSASLLSERPYPYTLTKGNYELLGSGLEGQYIDDYDVKPWSMMHISIQPKTLNSFTTFPEKELPKHLQHLMRLPSQEHYIRRRDTQSAMNVVLQQILHCPYQGMVKRAHLESKIIELMALVLDHEIAIQQGEFKQEALKPEQLERIHYAREILLKDLSNPPSLIELASQVGLSGTLLKSGFRNVFGTTVFGALQSCRLEIAKQLLVEQDTSVAEVAHLVGYTSARAFARAFRRKFQIGPKEYQKTCR